MNRRQAIRWGLASTATTLMAGSLSSITGCADESIRPLRFWNGFTGPDGRVMLDLVRKHAAETGGPSVQMQRIPWPTYYNKLLVAGLAGRGPEVFVLHMHAMPRFVNAGVLEPVDDLFDRRFAAERLLPHTLAGATFGERVYGLPLDVHPLGMYFNRGLLEAVGVEPPPDQPLSLDAFLDTGRRLTTAAPDGKWGFVYTWLRSNAYAIVRQFGGRLVDAAGSPAAMNSEAVIEALSFCRSLIEQDAIAPPPAGFDSFISFRQGQVGMLFEGSYKLPEMQRQDQFEFGTAPIPQLGPEPATWGDSHILCMKRGLTAARRAQALGFIRYLSNHSAIWATAGQVPTRLDMLERPEVVAMPHLRAFTSQLDRVAYFPRVGWVFELLTAFDYAVERVLHGRISPRDAMAEASADAERARVRYDASPEVRA